uniref:KRAB domain-containing protein n=1 Tax=Chrysemys picta bellii TaxID=8478 RepID=A0A8C3HNM2_CHRPI
MHILDNKSMSEWRLDSGLVAVWFSREEWEMLADWQKELYRAVMLENYEHLFLLGTVTSDLGWRIQDFGGMVTASCSDTFRIPSISI